MNQELSYTLREASSNDRYRISTTVMSPYQIPHTKHMV